MNRLAIAHDASNPELRRLLFPSHGTPAPTVRLTVESDATALRVELSSLGQSGTSVHASGNCTWLRLRLGESGEKADGGADAAADAFATEWSSAPDPAPQAG